MALLAAGIPFYVWLQSESIIQRRYPLASTTALPVPTAKDLVRGAHLVAVTGCADCHGADLEGRLLNARSVLPVFASNLTRAAQVYSDAELERAIRYAIRPDATTDWLMPSACYRYMSEADVAAIIAYLRTRPPAGPVRPVPRFDFAARWALATGRLEPAFTSALASPASLDPGPRYDGGRYLARIACAECHGTDFEGRGYAPDLNAISRYDRPSFFELLRRGFGRHGRLLPVMHRIAPLRFRAFADYEIVALYDYLDARAHAPAPLVERTREMRRHEEDARALAGAQ